MQRLNVEKVSEYGEVVAVCDRTLGKFSEISNVRIGEAFIAFFGLLIISHTVLQHARRAFRISQRSIDVGKKDVLQNCLGVCQCGVIPDVLSNTNELRLV